VSARRLTPGPGDLPSGDVSPPAGVLARLRAAGLSPRKALGQHFLHDPKLLAAIVAAAEVEPGDAVLEVGTGPATLTRAIAAVTTRVLSVEVDPRIADFARRELAGVAGVEILVADALDGRGGLATPVAAAIAALGPFRWIANLPYGIATPLILAIVESALPWRVALLTVQAEVAERLAATAVDAGSGSSCRRRRDAYGVLSVLVGARADVEIVRRLPAGAFWPPPRVESAVVRLRPRTPPLLTGAAEMQALRGWVHGLFRSRRKQLGGLLRACLGAPEAAEALRLGGWSARLRPENLGLDDYLTLARAYPDAFS